FWLGEKQYYALALQAGHKPAAVVASNPGQALWGGIVDPDKARPTVERLMAEDMFSGWGIRTLSAQERRYKPIGYHVGTVWPHDNALIAAGFRRYGFDTQGKRTLIFWEEHFGEIAVVPARFEPFDLDAPTSTLFLA